MPVIPPLFQGLPNALHRTRRNFVMDSMNADDAQEFFSAASPSLLTHRNNY